MKRGYLIVGGIILAVALIAAIPYITDVVQYLISDELLDRLKGLIEWAGPYGAVALMFVQLLQVVVAIIPGEPVEVLAGAMLGPVYGTIFCLVGLLVGNAIIFSIVRKFGRSWLQRQRFYKKIENMPYLSNTPSLKRTIFLIYLIPATPKDLLIYACALTSIELRDFLIITTISRLPSVLTSALIGSNLYKGNLNITVVMLVITVILAVAGLIFHEYRYGTRLKHNKNSDKCAD